MEYNKQLCMLQKGDAVEGFYILTTGSLRKTNAGKLFFSGKIADASGDVDFVQWDYSGTVKEENVGGVVKIRGDVSEYKGTMQMILTRIRPAVEQDQFDISLLVPTAPMDQQEAVERVRELVESLEDEEYKAICQKMLEKHLDRFRVIPAAKSVHHGFLSGLLMHTANMMETAEFLASRYAEVIDRSLLMAGVLLHDMAKEEEFVFSELGLAVDYSVKGQLLGHLVMGAQEVAETAKELEIPEEKSVLLQHLILSHHGEPEFGAAVRPMCAESELLSYIDLIDSRMEIYAETLPGVSVGEFSQKVFALDKRIYRIR